jgi:O-antigen ligase
MLSISGCLAVVYGFIYDYLTHSGYNFERFLVMRRNSDLLASLCLLNTVLLFEATINDRAMKFFVRTGLVISLVLFVTALLLIHQRGALLGLYVGLIVYSLVFNRKFLMGLITVTIAVAILINHDNSLMTWIKAFNKEKIASNDARHDLYISGFLYVLEDHLIFGTGAKKDSGDFMAFFQSQSQTFQDKYPQAKALAGNFHNSFLQMAAEGGGLFLILYLTGIGYVLYLVSGGLRDPKRRVACIGAIVTAAGAVALFFVHEELYSYGGIIFYIALLCGCFPETRCVRLEIDENSAV